MQYMSQFCTKRKRRRQDEPTAKPAAKKSPNQNLRKPAAMQT